MITSVFLQHFKNVFFVGMLKEEESNLEKKRWPMNKLRLLESDSDLSSYSSISSSFSPGKFEKMYTMHRLVSLD